MKADVGPKMYGLLAEFDGPGALVRAAQAAHDQGYRKVDAFSPYPVEGLAEALGVRWTAVPLIVLLGGLLGCFGGFFMQVYAATYSYAVNIGGKPLLSWPMFLPITFEVTILLASLIGVAGMLVLNGLPRPYHPLFNVDGFERSTRDNFFLCIEASDPRFSVDATRAFLQALTDRRVSVVPD